MNAAISNNQDWTMDNTSVHFNEETGASIVRLHGTKIAEVGEDYLKIFDGGYQTKTTKSRLNAILVSLVILAAPNVSMFSRSNLSGSSTSSM